MGEKETPKIDKFALVEIVPPDRDFITFEEGRCDGCNGCIVVCPMDLWKTRQGKAVLASDYRDKCMECGSCFIACESGAIDFTYPPAGTGVSYRYA